MQLTRRGFTLAELLVAMVLLGIVSTAIYRVLVNNQRVYLAQTQRIDLQQNIRAAATILPAEFRELDANEGDIIAMSATSLNIRAQRWVGFACSPPVLGVALANVPLVITGGAPGQPLFYGSRGINTATDRVFVYYDGNPTTRLDDAWVQGTFASALTPAAVCPGGGGPGRTINVNFGTLGGRPNFNGAIPAGAPVRGFELVTYQLYRPAGDTSWYIGLQPAGASMQPVIGPVLPNGLTFTYFNAAGAVTAVPAQVARIDITVLARTTQSVRTGGSSPNRTLVDTLVTSVALRNNVRPCC
jgi:prepilin-type N-terminal cleavage/methylation domain-containing protein